ncbi:glycosyltransferase family 4 protein [Tellurirhabdus rosea]|uniref:glycosyltransferase family 4 protein n=1 Tax=Tellurirhabdus rosea TaxID=2674997 RepID=UPI002250F33E|nr:glycosyltransferase family 1 protein [Tellurirhabdus rosea]
MKIGIDAKWYFEGPPSGRMVVRNLVDEFIRQNRRHELYLFVNSRHINQATALQHPNVTLVPVGGGPNLLANLLRLPYLAGKLGLDVVLYQNFSDFWPGRAKKIAYIHDVLFYDFPMYYSRIEQLYLRPMGLLARFANHLITISGSEKTRLLKHRIGSDDTIDVVHHGISSRFVPLEQYDPERLAAFDRRYQLPSDFLLYVGRINIRKNLLNLVKAMREVPAAKLVIVGGVDHKNIDVSHYLQEHGLTDRVIFTGHVPDEDLYLFYAKSRIFCFPSYAEGFGLPPLEAMRCGRPVIVSDRTSLPEVCGKAGVYVNPDDPADIAAKINHLLGDPQFYQEKSLQSLQHSGQFTWQESARRIINIIEKVAC